MPENTNGNTLKMTKSQKKLCEAIVQHIRKDYHVILVPGKGISEPPYSVVEYIKEEIQDGVKRGEPPCFMVAAPGANSGINKEYHAWKIALTTRTDIVGIIKDTADTLSAFPDSPLKGPAALLKQIMMFRRRTEKITHVLNDTDKELLANLNSLALSKKPIVFCPNFNQWDQSSLNLMSYILRPEYEVTRNHFKYLERLSIVIFYDETVQDDASKLCEDIGCFRTQKQFINKIVTIENPRLEKEDLTLILKEFGYQGEICEEEKAAILSTISNDLEALRCLAKILAASSENNDVSSFISTRDLNQIAKALWKRLEKENESLKKATCLFQLAALLGLDFSATELKHASDKDEREFKEIVAGAKRIEVFRDDDKEQYLRFSYNLIREAIRSTIGDSYESHNYRIQECLAKIRPGEYDRRSFHAFRAGDSTNAVELSILHAISQKWNTGRIGCSTDTSIREALLELNNDAYKNYYTKMIDAITSYQKHDFDAAIEILHKIDTTEVSASLDAQKCVMESYCTSKTLDKETRSAIIEQLKGWEANREMLDVSVYEQVLYRLSVSAAHVGNRDLAFSSREKLKGSLRARSREDIHAQMMLNSINRIASVFDTEECALISIEQSVEYFDNLLKNAKSTELNHLYKALTNLAASYCANGRYRDSLDTIVKIQEFENQYSGAAFPRREIWCNTACVAGVLAGELSPAEALARYSFFSEISEGAAENVFVVSNVAVLTCLSKGPKKAIEIIDKEIKAQQITVDLEGQYDFRLKLNKAVFLFLLNRRSDSLEILNSMDESVFPKSSEGGRQYRRFERIKEYIEAGNPVLGPSEWLKNFRLNESVTHTSTGPDEYYSLGFVFTVGYNWDL